MAVQGSFDSRVRSRVQSLRDTGIMTGFAPAGDTLPSTGWVPVPFHTP